MQKTDRIEVVPYDPNWPTIFAAEAAKIKKAPRLGYAIFRSCYYFSELSGRFIILAILHIKPRCSLKKL